MSLSYEKLRIGLALGAGGARGLAHIPVLEALDDLGIRPVQINGSSIGAIMGAAFASGMSGQEIRQVVLETLADRNAALSRLWKVRPTRLEDIFRKGPVQFDPLRVLDVFLASHLPERFEDLGIPLRVHATDFYGWQEVTFSSGPLLPSIAASIAVPAVFRPVKVDERHLIDGGVANPLPFDGLRAISDVVIAVDVAGVPVAREGRPEISRLDSLVGSSQILQRSITNQKLKTEQPDILIRPPHDNTLALDFLNAKRILDQAETLRELTRSRISSMIEHV